MRYRPFLLFLLVAMVISSTVSARVRYKKKHKAHGVASYYSNKYEGRKTANGETFSNEGYTAASNKFRLGAYVRVRNKTNGHTVYVKVNDRMGDQKRLIDLTTATSDALGFRKAGLADVKVKLVRPGKARRKIRRQSR
jgi:rare lipoprotein A